MPKTTSSISYETGRVISADGTSIGYRTLGNGPGLLLIHGGMQASQNFMKLANALADRFTLYIPDRRGRGLSGPHGNNYSIKKECEDIQALIHKTGACYIFGLSSGALISLHASLIIPAIQKTALYEPPVDVYKTHDFGFMPRYEKEIEKGKFAAAFITAVKGIKVSSFLGAIPRFLLVPILKFAFNKQEQKIKGNDVPLKKLVPTFHYDHSLVAGSDSTLENYKSVKAEVLILKGRKSPRFLKEAADKLAGVLPNVKCIEFPTLDHMGPDDNGKPEIVAEELKRFFQH